MEGFTGMITLSLPGTFFLKHRHLNIMNSAALMLMVFHAIILHQTEVCTQNNNTHSSSYLSLAVNETGIMPNYQKPTLTSFIFFFQSKPDNMIGKHSGGEAIKCLPVSTYSA